MDENIRPQLEETPTANDDALHTICVNTVEFAETTFENLQEKIRTNQVVLSLVIENFNSRNVKLQGNPSEYNSGFQKASDHDLLDGEDDVTSSESNHVASKRPANDNSNGGRVIEDGVSEDDHALHSLDEDHDNDIYDDDGEDDIMEDDHYYAGDADLANDTEEHVSSMNESESNSINLSSGSEENSEAEQYERASYEENTSIGDEDETMEDTLEDEQDIDDDVEDDSSHDRDSEEDHDDSPEDGIPETSKAEHDKNVCEFINAKNQHKTIARQQDEILKLKLANLNFDSQTDEAESLEYLSNTIAAGEAALEDQKQCLEELSKMVKQIRARMDTIRAHISKKRPGLLPQNDVHNIRNFCEKCQQDIKELLASYRVALEQLSTGGDDQEEGVGEDEVSDEHQTAEEEDEDEDQGYDVGEDDEEHEGEEQEEDEGEEQEEDEGEDQGEDDADLQGEAMLAPVQPAALTFTLPFIGGKRGREIGADETEPAAKRGRFIEEEL